MKLDIDPSWRAWLVNDALYAACEGGWHNIVHDLFQAFHNVFINAATSDARIKILQIKEKFAGLRIYWGEENVTATQHNAFFEIYQRAQDLSYRTCEICGRPGKLRERGVWLSTRCPDHF